MTEIDLLKERNVKVDWFALRNQAAMVNAAAILGNNEMITRIGIRSENDREDIHTTIAKCAIEHADSLINELQKPQFLKQGEQKPAMIQWKGDNLREIIDFTGCSPRFGEWFKTWEEYEKYVHSHNNIFKIFNEDGSHMEIPVGSWIIKAPDGYNTASRFGFVPKPAEWSEEDKNMLQSILDEYKSMPIEKRNWLKSFIPQNRWKPTEKEMEAISIAVHDSHDRSYHTELYRLKLDLKKLTV